MALKEWAITYPCDECRAKRDIKGLFTPTWKELTYVWWDLAHGASNPSYDTPVVEVATGIWYKKVCEDCEFEIKLQQMLEDPDISLFIPPKDG